MDFSNALYSYYHGEKWEALIVTISGFTVGGLLFWLQTGYRSAFARGMTYPVALFVLIAVAAGSYNVYNNSRRLSELPARYAQNKATFIANEWNRFEGINGVNQWWQPLNIAWATIVFTGIFVFLLVNTHYGKGVGLGLLFLGFSGMVIDGFAKERAMMYTQQLYEETEKINGDESR